MKVTFDGQGLNDTNEYASRIAKLQPEYLHLGPVIANAINSHAALKKSHEEIVGLLLKAKRVRVNDPMRYIDLMDEAISAAEKLEVK